MSWYPETDRVINLLPVRVFCLVIFSFCDWEFAIIELSWANVDKLLGIAEDPPFPISHIVFSCEWNLVSWMRRIQGAWICHTFREKTVLQNINWCHHISIAEYLYIICVEMEKITSDGDGRTRHWGVCEQCILHNWLLQTL